MHHMIHATNGSGGNGNGNVKEIGLGLVEIGLVGWLIILK